MKTNFTITQMLTKYFIHPTSYTLELACITELCRVCKQQMINKEHVIRHHTESGVNCAAVEVDLHGAGILVFPVQCIRFGKPVESLFEVSAVLDV